MTGIDDIKFFCECKNLIADGIKDLLYSWRLKASVLYLLSNMGSLNSGGKLDVPENAEFQC